jgi:peptidoglycan/LPS O-acetylase OafA/YrhL
MAFIGLISYGIFLWHMALIVFVVRRSDLFASGLSLPMRAIVATLLTALVAIPLSAFTYYLIERPVLRLKEPREKDAPVASA